MSESNEVLTEPKLERRTRRRFSVAEKQRLLAQADALPRGEQGAWLRRNGLYAAQLSQWRKTFAEQGTQGLEPKRGGRKPSDPRDREIERLRRDNARLERRVQVAEDLVALQKKTLGPVRTGAQRAAAMKTLAERPAHVPRSRACAALGLSRTGTYPRAPRRRSEPRDQPLQPRALSEAERQQLRDLARSAHYRDASLPVLYATELNAGRVIASLSSFYRVLRADGETRERRAQRAPGKHAVPHLIADRPHACWSWDISKLPTLAPRRYLNLYLILDLYSRYVIAWMISAKENGALAKHLFGQALSHYDIPD